MTVNVEIPAAVRTALRGSVTTPNDAGYDAARAVFYGGIDGRPALIVRAADERDVRTVVAYARDAGLELAVRSGGHSAAGHSTTEGGIVLDLRDLTALDIDVGGRTAWAGTGLTAAAYTTAVGAHGLATGLGDTGSVGLGGITLGGGVGYLVRKHGLTIDSLLGAEIVTADGELLRVDQDHHPDLFWAIRGGGGNFGVATRFHLRLQEVPTVVGGMLVLPATPEVVEGFVAQAEAAPEELSTIANVMSAPPMPFLPAEHHGKLIVMALVAYAGDAEAGTRVMDRFRALARPLADMVRPMTYAELYPPEDPSYHPTAVGRTMFVGRVDGDVTKTILGHLAASDAAMRVAQVRVLGGAMARVPADATAFAHRASRIMVNVAAFYDGAADRPRRQAWVDAFAAALLQGDAGQYVNFIAEDDPVAVRAAYPGGTWDRLVEIKRRYDPANLFHRNHNIPPRA